MVFLATYGLSVVGAIIILILGWIVARIGQRMIRNLLEKSKVDAAVVSFVGSLTYFLILTFAVLAALAKFGVQTTSFVAVMGAAGFAVGFALQGSLANFAAGVLILLLRPFRVGDDIMGAGEAGTVKEITLFTTVLATADNVKVLVPNGKLFGDVIKNAPLMTPGGSTSWSASATVLTYKRLMGLLMIFSNKILGSSPSRLHKLLWRN